MNLACGVHLKVTLGLVGAWITHTLHNKHFFKVQWDLIGHCPRRKWLISCTIESQGGVTNMNWERRSWWHRSQSPHVLLFSPHTVCTSLTILSQKRNTGQPARAADFMLATHQQFLLQLKKCVPRGLFAPWWPLWNLVRIEGLGPWGVPLWVQVDQ